LPLQTDANGLPIHGTMVGSFAWEVVRTAPARLVARYAYENRAFPFPHELEIDARVSERGLQVAMSPRPTGRRAVPVSFGCHPYFKAERTARLRVPACRHLELDERGIPTGRSDRRPAQELGVAERPLDDHYALGRDRTFVLHRRKLDVEIRFGPTYPYAQLFAPPGKRFVAVEPMTAPTDALVTGAAPLVKPGTTFRAVFVVRAVLL
jgi:galactose mutarotase-like enzyme